MSLLSRFQALKNAPNITRLRNLYRRFDAWMFGTPTMIIQVLNTAFLLTWGALLLNETLLEIPLYAGYLGAKATEIHGFLSGVFFVAAFFALVGFVCKSYRGDMFSGFALQLGAVLWLCVAMNYHASYPPMRPGLLTYGFFALMCQMAGTRLWRIGYARTQARDARKKQERTAP